MFQTGPFPSDLTASRSLTHIRMAGKFPGTGAGACLDSFHTHVQGSLIKIPLSDKSFALQL